MALKATVQGDRIHWLEDSEQSFPASRLVQALIIPLDEPATVPSPDERAQRRLAALKKLASLDSFTNIQDPVAWQRDVRTERERTQPEP